MISKRLALPAIYSSVWPLIVLVMLSLLCQLSAARFDQYTERFKQPERPVDVITAGCVGSDGVEYLVGGGFLPNEDIVVVGNAWGPSLQLANTTLGVLGTDTSPKALPAPVVVPGKKGKKDKIKPMRFDETDGAGFVLITDPQGSKVKLGIRLPWNSGTVVSAVVDDVGNIYIALLAGEQFSSLGIDPEVLKTNTEPSGSEVLKQNVLLQFNAQLEFQWARQIDEANVSARLRVVDGHVVYWHLQHSYAFTADGILAETLAVRESGGNWAVTYDPRTGGIAQGYFNRHNTGREPWHQPWLEVIDKEGVMTQLYRWHGRLVGHDHFRLVSDSKVMKLHYANDGSILIAGWSDGGNTVYQRKPYDLKKPHGKIGLGFSAWGAGVLSLGHVVKLHPQTYEVENYTLWCGYLQESNSPNSARIEFITDALGGDIILGGRASWGLIQTGDKLSNRQPAGSYLTILDKSFGTLRFSSVLPATSHVMINHQEEWSAVSQSVKGREKLLVLTSAKKETVYREEITKPVNTSGHFQQRYGGGRSDGYFIAFDLGAAP